MVDVMTHLRAMALADSQIGCMATFSGTSPDEAAGLVEQGVLVRPYDATDQLTWDVSRLRQAVAVADELGPDLVVTLGDMVDDLARPDQLEAFRHELASLAVPVRFVAGNHDLCPDAATPTEASITWFEQAFGPIHWTSAHDVHGGRVTFVAVASPLLHDPGSLTGADEAELAFLEGALRGARDVGAGPIVVLSHHPPYVTHPDEADSYWNLPSATRRTMLDLLVEHRVDLVLCGHRHRNDTTRFGGVEIVTSSAAGFPLGFDPPGYRLLAASSAGVDHVYEALPTPGWDDIGGRPWDPSP